MENKRLLITGSSGQLGRSVLDLSGNYPAYEFITAPAAFLSVYNESEIVKYLSEVSPGYIINCAAYTAVDKAESEPETALLVNATAVGYLARFSAASGCRLIHISTDYVFDGNSALAYTETDSVNPVNMYGRSKLLGENLCLERDPDSIIIRTAWVYSEHGKNFVKTMLRLMKEKDDLQIVSDQTGTPTYAADLAEAIMQIIDSENWVPGIYHYASAGKTSWFEFARFIRDLAGLSCELIPVKTDQYPTAAKRPAFSLLDTNKIRSTYQIQIADWEDSLKRCLIKLRS